MSESVSEPSFAVITGTQVRAVLEGDEQSVVSIIEGAYRLHGAGKTVNPPSYFLRFPDRPSDRIIALPASLGGNAAVNGIKWIASYPGNTAAGIPRASAVQLLNDPETGYPLAVLEASVISATRTAASAALAADQISRARNVWPKRIGFFGNGLIARYIHTYLERTGWQFDEIGLYDTDARSLDGFQSYLERSESPGTIVRHSNPRSIVENSDMIVFATVAGVPHVSEPGWFGHAPLVLHISLRDLSPAVVLRARNIVDDVDHCLKAGTSLHLAEQDIGDRHFVHGTLCQVLDKEVSLPADQTVIFSPFGLGILDLAVAKHVYDYLTKEGNLRTVPGFFSDLNRFGDG
ncbi:2,3-diaminopropionate biosynthesis protein SbnB [Amycolatopsis sp. H20-H5]|uniref:2,3-diaminopropionate biosynthesis protein SbnB n=1 Tax=Amycolatopsis sp. H20-H5 TaxID=3046309 RepID=UPI002DBA9C0A|nr:2,3-diaminopropionate biosynthesis protein SbnB [Amycolatopsis sp. H20-H5]MEC3975536.1 2,3-diaminopropionate biosynthesis protein SbnB [Amycolatopsis sp. H20-H5]